IWRLDPAGVNAPVSITGGAGRQSGVTIRWQNLSRDQNYVMFGEDYLFTLFNNKNKTAGIKWVEFGKPFGGVEGLQQTHPTRLANFVKAKQANVLRYSTEDYAHTPGIRVGQVSDVLQQPLGVKSLYEPNPQQSQYLWGTA
ncbi:MAG TPA: hypothetical protein VLL95_07575, partial [Phnomibacter sp.]|nr:hypothetical protein [Phnomibacter sp.]